MAGRRRRWRSANTLANPALDAADPADAPPFDQRGLPRDATPDIGSFELEGTPPSSDLVVTTLADVVDATDGVLSLREAIGEANARAGADTITFAEAHPRRHDRAAADLPTITDDLVIDGDPLDRGAGGIVIDGAYAFQVNYGYQSLQRGRLPRHASRT